MSSKSALKAVRTALDSKDFELAADKAKQLVQQEPQNYHAYVNIPSGENLVYSLMVDSRCRNVFLGLALDKLGKTNEAEKAYLAATQVKSDDKTAWQGLANLYERQGNLKLEPYREAVVHLARIYGEAYVPQTWNFTNTS